MCVCCLLDVFQSPKISLVASIVGRELVSGAVGMRHLSRLSLTNKSLEIAEPLYGAIFHDSKALCKCQSIHFSNSSATSTEYKSSGEFDQHSRLKEYTKPDSNKILPCCRCYQGLDILSICHCLASVFALVPPCLFQKVRKSTSSGDRGGPTCGWVRRQLLKLSVSSEKNEMQEISSPFHKDKHNDRRFDKNCDQTKKILWTCHGGYVRSVRTTDNHTLHTHAQKNFPRFCVVLVCSPK